MRRVDRNFFRLAPGSLVVFCASMGGGKSWLLGRMLEDSSLNMFSDSDKPRRLIYSSGAADDIQARSEELKKNFEVIERRDDLEERLESLRETFSGFGLNVLVLEDFFLTSLRTFRSLSSIVFKNLRHDRCVVLLTMQAVTHQSCFNLLLGHCSQMFLHATPSNHSTISRICHKFNTSPLVRQHMDSELDSMIRSGVHDCMLLDFRKNLAVCNFQTLSLTKIKRGVEELNKTFDMSARTDGEACYYLVPSENLRRGPEAGESRPKGDIREILDMIPKSCREEASSILKVLRKTGLDAHINWKTLMFSPESDCTCAIIDLVLVVCGAARQVPSNVRGVLSHLEARQIGIPRVRRGTTTTVVQLPIKNLFSIFF